MNYIGKLGDLQDSPFAQDMNSNLAYSRANNIHRFPVRWFQPTLYCIEFRSSLPARFGWEVAEVIKT